MANSLNKNLKEGQVVILSAKYFKGTEAEREFEVQSGFGMSTFTRGYAIFGKFVSDGEKTRVEGYQIERLK